MDRDNNWELTEKAYALIAHGVGEKSNDFSKSLGLYYERGFPDTKIPALVAPDYTGVQEHDAVFFFNFREDSIRQLYKKFAEHKQIYLATMTKYTEEDTSFVFAPPDVTNNLAEVISANNLPQLHIAETLKYAHVTYFFNGLKNWPYGGEKDVLVQSEKNIETTPAMGAEKIAETVIAGLQTHDVIIANFANADMLAHTGNYEATRAGVEAIDTALGMVLRAITEVDGILLITSDHGNAESLVDRFSSEPESRHDGSPVPIYFVAKQYFGQGGSTSNANTLEVSGILADVAPTVLALLGISAPSEMTGVSLLPKLPVRDR